MRTIRLPRGVWHFDESRPLGKAGGFGEVFEGQDDNGSRVAVKRLKLSVAEAGHRELELVDALIGRALDHVIPVLDAGLDAEDSRYFIIMSRAEHSLRDVLNTEGTLREQEAREVLLEITSGLLEIGQIVHRDLKPDNILRHDDKWKIADLGIARFAEEATSLNTLKGFLSAAYAAPEQWRGETASHATDVYALGALGFELLMGAPPFPGPKREDYMAQHLTAVPPRPGGSPQIQLLIAHCLRKPQAARPTIASLRARLASSRSIAAAGPEAELARVAAGVVHAQTAAEAKVALDEQKRRARKELANCAREALSELAAMLFERIDESTQGAAQIVGRSGQGGVIPGDAIGGRALGRGELIVTVVFPVLTEGTFAQSNLDAACGALIHVDQAGHPYCGGRSANLWYCDPDGSGSFAWREQSYMFNPMVGRSNPVEPFGIFEKDRLAVVDQAHGNVMGILQRATKLRPVEGEALDAFVDRWLGYFASAAAGGLMKPNPMPEEAVQ